MFYHDRDYSPNFDKARSVRADSLFFNADGTIKKVIPTLRGVGLTDATKEIQLDRFSSKSGDGVAVDFIDTTNRFLGWKTIFNKSNGWIQYNSVDFGKKKIKSVNVKAVSKTGGVLQIHLNNSDGPVIAELKIPASDDWRNVKASLSGLKQGIHNVVMSLKGVNPVEVDWIRFE